MKKFIHMLTQALVIKYLLFVKHCPRCYGSKSLNISLHSKWEEGDPQTKNYIKILNYYYNKCTIEVLCAVRIYD